MNLKTKYLGLELKNPIIVSSSPLTKNWEGIKKCADAGAGAIVLKSLFEEQMSADLKPATDDQSYFSHPEAEAYVQNMGMTLNSDEYLDLITKASTELDIPVLASLNCVNPEWWTTYAVEVERAGAAAIELNISLVPDSKKEDAVAMKKRLIEIIKSVKSKVNIPISVKLGHEFGALPNLLDAIELTGVDGVVLFNRYYQADIDLDSLNLKIGKRFSAPEEFLAVLREIALVSDQTTLDIAASTGIHTENEAIKAILVGSSAVQVCSTLFKNKIDQIATIQSGIENWMKDKGFNSIEEFKGKLSQKKEDSLKFERLQYIKALVGTE